MAEKCVEQVEDILTCPMCLEVLKEPQTFNCLHSYCRTCVTQLTLIKQEHVEGYECPQCRRFTPKKEARTIHLIVQLLDAYQTAKNVPNSPKCEQCNEKESNWKCVDCEEESLLCDACKLNHDKFSRRFRTDHHVIPLSELTQMRQVIDRPIYCTEHKDNKLEVFCTECKQVLCVLCKIFDHDGHKAEPIADALKRLVPKIDSKTEQIKTNIKETQKAIEAMKTEKEKAIKSCTDTKDQLNKELNKKIDQLRSEYKAKMNKVDLQKDENVKELTEKIHKAENQITEQNQVLAWVSTTTARTKGVTLLKELQGGLIEKVEQVSSQLTTPCFTVKNQGLQYWPSKLCGANLRSQKGKTIDLVKTGSYSYPYTRVGLLWNQLSLFNRDPSTLYQYNVDGSSSNVIKLDKTIEVPRSAVQVSETEAILASKSGLFVIQQNGRRSAKLIEGDFSDVCLGKDLNTIYGLKHNTGVIVCFFRSVHGCERKADIILEGYTSCNENVDGYFNTFAVNNHFVYVSMIHVNTIAKYSMAGKKLQLFTPDKLEATLPSICGITKDGSLVTCDLYENAIKQMSEDGNTKNIFGTERPTWHAVAVNDDAVWVLNHPTTLQQYTFLGAVH